MIDMSCYAIVSHEKKHQNIRLLPHIRLILKSFIVGTSFYLFCETSQILLLGGKLPVFLLSTYWIGTSRLQWDVDVLDFWDS